MTTVNVNMNTRREAANTRGVAGAVRSRGSKGEGVAKAYVKCPSMVFTDVLAEICMSASAEGGHGKVRPALRFQIRGAR